MALRMLEGKLFQSFGAATEKERSPRVASVLRRRALEKTFMTSPKAVSSVSSSVAQMTR